MMPNALERGSLPLHFHDECCIAQVPWQALRFRPLDRGIASTSAGPLGNSRIEPLERHWALPTSLSAASPGMRRKAYQQPPSERDENDPEHSRRVDAELPYFRRSGIAGAFPPCRKWHRAKKRHAPFATIRSRCTAKLVTDRSIALPPLTGSFANCHNNFVDNAGRFARANSLRLGQAACHPRTPARPWRTDALDCSAVKTSPKGPAKDSLRDSLDRACHRDGRMQDREK